MKKNVKKQLAEKRPNVSRGFTSKTFDVNDFVMPYPIYAPTSIVTKNTKHVTIFVLNKYTCHIIESKIFCEVKSITHSNMGKFMLYSTLNYILTNNLKQKTHRNH
jgi:hypothetical protein